MAVIPATVFAIGISIRNVTAHLFPRHVKVLNPRERQKVIYRGCDSDLEPASQLQYGATMHLILVPPSQVFQSLSDPCRVRIVRLMVATRDEICLCELVDSLQEPQSKLSRHVKALRQAGLLTAERSGRWVYHRLVSEPPFLQSLFGAIALLEDPGQVFVRDLERFRARACLREDGRCRLGIQTAQLAAGSDVD